MINYIPTTAADLHEMRITYMDAYNRAKHPEHFDDNYFSIDVDGQLCHLEEDNPHLNKDAGSSPSETSLCDPPVPKFEDLNEEVQDILMQKIQEFSLHGQGIQDSDLNSN